MARVLICLLGFLVGWEFENLAVAQEPTPVAASSSALLCDAMPGEPSNFRPKRSACMACCFPASCCCDDYTPHRFPRSCFPAYPPWYQCVPAGDVASCANACPNKKRRSWWFIPTRHAFREAIWLDP